MFCGTLVGEVIYQRIDGCVFNPTEQQLHYFRGKIPPPPLDGPAASPCWRRIGILRGGRLVEATGSSWDCLMVMPVASKLNNDIMVYMMGHQIVLWGKYWISK